jgi:hypothetical protein
VKGKWERFAIPKNSLLSFLNQIFESPLHNNSGHLTSSYTKGMATSPPRSQHSPTRKAKSPTFTTRYGITHNPETKFGKEERFQWQNAQFVSDVAYQLPDTKSKIGSIFGTSARGGLDDMTADSKKRSTGPGSYNVEEFDCLSEYLTHKGPKFSCAARQGMDMKTPSPGAVYNTSELFRSGKDKAIKISFNCDRRPPLYNPSISANADLLLLKPDRGPSVTIGQRLKPKSRGADTPGAIYEVHKIQSFKTGPSFSFGRSKQSRFKEDGFSLSLDP